MRGNALTARRLIIGSALSALALTGCSGGGGESVASSSTTTTAPSSTTSSSTSRSSGSPSSSSTIPGSTDPAEAPELPKVATKHTQEGALAFAKYYWNEQGRAHHVGDSSTLETLYSSDCEVCQTYVDSINDAFADGLHADRLPTTIHEATVTDETAVSDQAARIVATDASYQLVGEDGKAVGRTEEVDYRIIIFMNWERSSWVVVDSYMIT